MMVRKTPRRSDISRVAQNSAHQDLVDAILKRHGSRSDLTLWENKTGGMAHMRWGLKGSADLLGIYSPCQHIQGHLVAIEVKTGKATQTHQQRRFQEMIDRHGGTYLVARDTDLALPLCELCS